MSDFIHRDDGDKLALIHIQHVKWKKRQRRSYVWLWAILIGIAVGFGIPLLMVLLRVEGW